MNSKLIIALLIAAVCVELNQGALNPLVRAGYGSPGTKPQKPVPGNAATTAPPAVTAAPTAVTAAPTAVTAAPTAVTAAPTAVTAAPTAVTAAPPAVTAAPPAVTDAPPAVTAAPPAATAAPPAATAAPPAATAAPPAATAAPPAVTAAPPAVTDAPPTVTAAPPAVTAAPTAATAAPPSDRKYPSAPCSVLEFGINSNRAKHSSPPMKCDEAQLKPLADQCSDFHSKLKSIEKNEDPPTLVKVPCPFITALDQKEMLYMAGCDPSAQQTMLNDWYKEGAADPPTVYDSTDLANADKKSHFNQLVWANTNSFYCSIGTPSDSKATECLHVCIFAPAGDVRDVGVYSRNIKPPK